MDRIFKYGVGGVFFLLPIFFLIPPIALTIDAQLIQSKFLLCFLLGSLSLSVLVAQRGQRYLSLVHALITVSVFVTAIRQPHPYIYWIAALSLALVFVSLEDGFQRLCIRAVVYAAVVSSVLGIFQVFDLDPLLSYAPSITEADRRLPAGLMGQATKHGALLAMALGMALGLRMWVAALLIAVAVGLTQSSFTYLAAAGAVLVWLKYEWGKRAVLSLSFAGLGVAVGLFLFKSSHTMDHGRFDVWQATLSAWWNGPIVLGYGLGSFAAPTGPGQTLFAQFFQPQHLRVYGDFHHAHNDYIQAVFEMGLLGVAGILAGLWFLGSYYCRVWWAGDRKREVIVAAECGLVAILLNALGNFPFQLAPHYLLAVIFVALLLDKSNEGYNKL